MLFTVKARKEAAPAPAGSPGSGVTPRPAGPFGLVVLFILVSWACRQLWRGLGGGRRMFSKAAVAGEEGVSGGTPGLVPGQRARGSSGSLPLPIRGHRDNGHPVLRPWKGVQDCAAIASNFKLQLLEWTESSIRREGTD